MKFVSWNVNGIRACITKGFEESFQKLKQSVERKDTHADP